MCYNINREQITAILLKRLTIGGVSMSDNFEQELEGFESTEKTREEIEAEKQEKQVKQIQRIIQGVNDVWEKKYDFPDLQLKFKLKVRAPNILEQGKIHAKVVRYLEGTNGYASEYYLYVFNTLATLQVTGVEVPDFLKNEENLYNAQILYKIGVDFQRWLDTFQG